MTSVEFNKMYKRFTKLYDTKDKGLRQVVNNFRTWQKPHRAHVTFVQQDAIKDIHINKVNIIPITFMRRGKEVTTWRDTLTGYFTKERPRSYKG